MERKTTHCSFVSNNRDGYILYLVLIVLSIMCIFTSVIVLSLHSTGGSAISDTKKYQARLLAESGVARVEYFFNGGDGHSLQWETDSLTEPIENVGIIKAACRRFGAYAKLVCQGTRMSTSCVMTSLAGRTVPDTLKPVMTLTSNIRGLVLFGRMVLKGNVVLHPDSVYRSENEGAPPRKIHDPSLHVTIRAADSLPFSMAPLDTMLSRLKNASSVSANDTTALKGNLGPASDSGSGIAKRSPLYIPGDYELKNVAISDKTIISSGTFTLGENAACEFCTIMAKKIIVLSGSTDKCLFYSSGMLRITGGNHDSQFFSEDSIVAGKNVLFGDMTLWVSRKNIERRKTDTMCHGGIFFEDAGTYTGCAICYSDTSTRKGVGFRGPSIVFGENCSFTGYLITEGDIEIGYDVIEGRIWAKTVTGRKNGQKKTYWLYAKSIIPLQRELPFPLLGDSPVRIRMSKTGYEYR